MLRQCLGGCQWIDVDLGMKYNRKAERYLRILRDFAVSNDNAVSKARQLLAAGDVAEARRLVHSLKGGSGMLGIVGVQDPAAELEAMIVDNPGSVPEELMALVEQRFAEVKAVIAALPSE